MTSNIGASARGVMGFNKDSSIAKDEELKSFFTPEFRNRLDAIVEFEQLSIETIQSVIMKFIDELNSDLKKKKITISISENAREFIAKSAYSAEMGARPLKRYIQDNITNKLSDEILFGKLKNGGKVEVGVKDKLILRFKQLNDSKTK